MAGLALAERITRSSISTHSATRTVYGSVLRNDHGCPPLISRITRNAGLAWVGNHLLVHKGAQALSPEHRNGQNVAALSGQFLETVKYQPSPAGHTIACPTDSKQLIPPASKPSERALRGIVQKLRAYSKTTAGE